MKKVLNTKILTAQSMAASFESTPLNLYDFPGHQIQLAFTGSPVGTFKIMSSVDTTGDSASVTNWDDVSDSSQAISAAGSHTWTVNSRYKWLKVVYTRTSGTGTCDGTIFAVRVS